MSTREVARVVHVEPQLAQAGELDGVSSVEASYDDGTAVVTYDPDKVTPEQIVAAIEELGYDAKLRKDDGTTT